MADDPKLPPAEQPQTIKLDAVQVLSELIRGVAAEVKSSREETKADFALLAGQFETLEQDVRGMQSWRVRVDDRLKSNSLRAQATTGVDLEQDAKLAKALVQLAEEKARGDKLEANAATKEDLKAITVAQTSAIVEGVKGVQKLAEKSPVVRGLLYALAGLVLVAINAATTYLAAKGH